MFTVQKTHSSSQLCCSWVQANGGYSRDRVREGECPLAAMQFCIDLLAAGCNCLEVPDARASVAYCMDELVVFEPQARQMAGVPIIKASGEKVGVLCVVSCYAQQSTASCRKGLTHVALF